METSSNGTTRRDSEELEERLERLRGWVELPIPAVSAVKIGGERAYRLARRGVEVDMPVRRSHVAALDVITYSGTEVTLDLRVGSGTYVRASRRRSTDTAGRCGVPRSGLSRLPRRSRMCSPSTCSSRRWRSVGFRTRPSLALRRTRSCARGSREGRTVAGRARGARARGRDRNVRRRPRRAPARARGRARGGDDADGRSRSIPTRGQSSVRRRRC